MEFSPAGLGKKPLAIPLFVLCALVFSHCLYRVIEAWITYVRLGVMNAALIIDSVYAVCTLFLLMAAAFHLFLKGRGAHRIGVILSFVLFLLFYLLYLLLSLVSILPYYGSGLSILLIPVLMSRLISHLISLVPFLFVLLAASVRWTRRFSQGL